MNLRRSLGLALVLAFPFAASVAFAAGELRPAAAPIARQAATQTAPPKSVSPEAPSLDVLFKALKAAKTAEEASAVEMRIHSIWLESGSDTVDLFMKWALEAMLARNDQQALDYLDQVITLKPDFAEGYNKRATLLFEMQRDDDALADVHETLKLEPRHFGALSGMGMILEQMGNKRGALQAFRRAFALNPFMPSMADHIKTLALEVEGQPI